MAIAVGTEAVFEDVGGDTVRSKKLCVARALVFGEVAVAAAGENDHGGAVAFSQFRRVGRERGRILRALAECAGCVAFPKADWAEDERVGHGSGGSGWRFFFRSRGAEWRDQGDRDRSEKGREG